MPRATLGLVVRVSGVSGDAEIYAKHRDEPTGFARVLVGRSDAPDVVSTVVTRLLASGRSLVDLRDPRSYLMPAVLNESRSILRRGREPSEIEPPMGLPASDGHVAAAVAGLPAQQRAVTFLAYWEEMTSNEIAQMLGIRPATVRRYLHLAREKLRGVLDDQ
jgi:DNA-directed RNA polymerase specialized sigma24 family protein